MNGVLVMILLRFFGCCLIEACKHGAQNSHWRLAAAA
jgi:hypothetical protein